jgi:HEAT repeat protein
MYRMQLALALSAALGTGTWWSSPSQAVLGPAVVQGPADEPASRPREPWLQADPADSMYRAAREALNRQDFRRAADLFAQIPNRFPRSGYAPDALYWQAFALYRLGGTRELRAALAALSKQRDQYADAATKGDAAALERRIQGELARRGDPNAAIAVREAAENAAAPPTPPVPAEASEAPEPPEPPEPPESDGDDGRCADDDDDMKIAALNALIHMDSDKARPILTRVLERRDPASVCLRRKAVFLVSQGDSEGTEEVLLKSARTDPDLEVREQAIFWLSQVGSERAVAALDSVLRSSTDRRLQDKAIFALSQQDSPRARQALRTFAERADAPEGLREQAIFWIGQTGGKESFTYLRELFGRIKNEELRKKILFSISQGDENGGAWLVSVARDRAQPLEMRKQALFWAGQGDASIADLVSLYSAFDDREMKDQMIFVYSQRDETAATDKLLEIARRDSDTELRKKALFWLGQRDDPRAAKALQDIIDEP